MKKNYLIFLLFIVQGWTAKAQDFEWAKSFGGSSWDGGQSITVDASGNVYTTGIFWGTVDFDPGAGTTNLTSVGQWDIFVQKLDASGNFLWAKSFGGSSDDFGYSTVDASGNVYTTGSLWGTVDFDPGAGTTNLTSVGGFDVFIQKLNQGSATTGTDEIGNDNRVVVYPNPTKGTVNIAFEQNSSNVELLLTDVKGKVVYAKMYNTITNTTLTMPNPKGIYF